MTDQSKNGDENKADERKEEKKQSEGIFQGKAPLIIEDDMNLGLNDIDESIFI